MRRRHGMPFGAELVAPDETRFRLWAPKAQKPLLALARQGEEELLPMAAGADGWHEAIVRGVGAGARYAYTLEDGTRVPDPASRFQPDDVHGMSEVIDPEAYEWSDANWRGRPWHEAVLYELHVGAFTPAGTYRGVADKLDHLAALGVTAVELMPVAEFPGRRNWGYDGALPFAPDAAYGRPEDLKALIDRAHARGIMMFLDVVYNHFGPDGNYLGLYAPFFTDRHSTPWGAGINFDGPDSRPVRDFFIENALYWLTEYRFDGLRFDAVHAIEDDSRVHILTELARRVRETLAGDRQIHLVLENDDNEARYLGLGGYDAQWNDDIHHAFHCATTGEDSGYYADYAADPATSLGRALASGFAYQGEPSPYREGKKRGEPSGHLAPSAFVAFLQNHDQVGNRAFGERISDLAEEDARRAALAILLLVPSPPLLFMGEEWQTRRPFLYFCDFADALADAVREGRRREFAGFAAFRDETARARIPDPNAEDTFRRSVLDWAELNDPGHRQWLDFCRALLTLRRREIVPRLAGMKGGSGRFERFGDGGLVCAWTLGDGNTLRLLANLAAEPADPPAGAGEGRLFFSLPDPWEAAGRLPGWSVAWLLANAADDAGDAG